MISTSVFAFLEEGSTYIFSSGCNKELYLSRSLYAMKSAGS